MADATKFKTHMIDWKAKEIDVKHKSTKMKVVYFADAGDKFIYNIHGRTNQLSALLVKFSANKRYLHLAHDLASRIPEDFWEIRSIGDAMLEYCAATKMRN